ncbi:hypothetical protein BsWGS_20198 [Bradybaena similaris]
MEGGGERERERDWNWEGGREREREREGNVIFFKTAPTSKYFAWQNHVPVTSLKHLHCTLSHIQVMALRLFGWWRRGGWQLTQEVRVSMVGLLVWYHFNLLSPSSLSI